jgi:hypothetical protein
MMAKTLINQAEQALNETDQGFNEQSKTLIAVDAQYLDGGAFDLQFFIRRCQHSAQTIAQHYLYLGRDLLVIKERVARDDFVSILDQIGISPRSAQRFMQVAVKFTAPTLEKLATRVAVSKLIELASEDDEDLEQALNGGTIAGMKLDDIERMSTRELKAALRTARSNADLTQEAHDRVLLQKNTHADELAKKLALAEHRPVAERWPEQVAAYHEELNRYGADAEQMLSAVFDIVIGGDPDLDMPIASQESIALATIDRVNRLTALVAQMQNTVFNQYGQFINQPAYELGDPLTVKIEPAPIPAAPLWTGLREEESL